MVEPIERGVGTEGPAPLGEEVLEGRVETLEGDHLRVRMPPLRVRLGLRGGGGGMVKGCTDGTLSVA